MPALAVIGTVAKVAGAVSTVKSGIDAIKGAKGTQAAAQGQVANPTNTPTVDIAALDAQVREIARKNAIESQQLEQELTPEVADLRRTSIQSLQGDLSPDVYDQTVRAGLLQDFQNASPTTLTGRSDLSRSVYDRAAADLALGAELPQDVRNEILRRSAATAGRVGGGALDLGRDIGARDLGLNSLDLLNQRMAAAQGIGMQEDQYRMTGDQFRANENARILQNRAAQAGLIYNMGNADAQRRLQIANLTQNIDRPTVGLDPGSVASIAIGNQNALQAYLANQQAIATQAGNAKSAATGQLIGAIPGVVNTVGGLFGNSNYGTSLGYNTGVNNSLNNFYGNLDSASSTMNYCWVARSVYGENNPKWLRFRKWLLSKAPASLRSAYIRKGEKFAAWLEDHPENKAEVRGWMDTILEGEGAQWQL